MAQPTAAQQEAYLERVRTEIQAQMMQDLMNKITESCFKKCTGKSGDEVDRREQQCLAMCSDRYMDTMGVVNQALMSRQNK
eukprot:gene3434-4526_t